MISVSESAAPVRFNPLFPQGAVSPPLVEANTARALSLKDGQVVQAMVQSQGDQLSLLLRGRLIGVPHLPDWEVGQRLRFKAQGNPDGSITLHLLSRLQAPASPAPAASLSSPVGATSEAGFPHLASLLHRPPGLPELRQLFVPGGLDALLARSAAQTAQLQAQWQAMQMLPGQLTGEHIRMLVGAVMGCEIGITRSGKPSALDPKQMLHELLECLAGDAEENGSDVAQVKRAIADLDSAQLSAIQAQRAGEMAISLLVPMHNEPPIELGFERRPAGSHEGSVFSVNVHSSSADLGELWLKADLHADKQIDLVMWALQDWVVAHAQAGAPELSTQMQDAGLQMRSFQAHHGARPAALPATPIAQSLAQPGVLLDLRA